MSGNTAAGSIQTQGFLGRIWNRFGGNKQNPSAQKSLLSDLLAEYGLPPGLFPKNITSYEFNKETKKITVRMPRANCDVGNTSMFRFSNTVTGQLEKGKLFGIEGIKTYTGSTWEIVTSMKVKVIKGKKRTIQCTGQVDCQRSFDEFTTPKEV